MKKYKLSRFQLEIINLEKQYSDVPGYVCAIDDLIWLDTTISDETVVAAIHEIIRTEQALRLHLIEEDGSYYMVETPYTPIPIPIITLDKDSKDEMEKEIALRDDVMELQGHKKPNVIKIYRSPHLLAVNICVSHLFFDGVSAYIFTVNLIDLCRRIQNGEKVNEPIHQFAEYIDENDNFHSVFKEEDFKYWREKVSDWEGLCKVAPDKKYIDNLDGDTVITDLDSTLNKQIKSYCDTYQISPTVIFQAAWVIYLYQRNPHRRNISMGVNTAGRNGKMQKATMGCFLKESFLQVSVSESFTIRELCTSIQSCLFESYHHSNFLDEDVLAVIREKYPETNSIYDVLFGYLPPPKGGASIDETSWFNFHSPETSVEYMAVEYSHFELRSYLHYRKSIFTREEAIALNDAILRILDFLTTHEPTFKISNFKL